MIARRLRATLLIALAAAASAGCATVQPWERATLAHDFMQTPVDPWDAGYFSKVQAVREGSRGGAAGGGGGCGCN